MGLKEKKITLIIKNFNPEIYLTILQSLVYQISQVINI